MLIMPIHFQVLRLCLILLFELILNGPVEQAFITPLKIDPGLCEHGFILLLVVWAEETKNHSLPIIERGKYA